MSIKRELNLDAISNFRNNKEPEPVVIEPKKIVKAILEKKVNTANGLNVRKDADKNSEVIKVLKDNADVKVSEFKDGFFKLADEEGWVMANFLK